MEEEELNGLNPLPKDDKQYDDLFTSMQTASRKHFKGATPGAKVYGYDTPLGKSKYDEKLLPSIQLDKKDFFKSLESYRATAQPTSHKLGNALFRLTNVIPESIGSIASALDFEDYYNTDKEVGNWLTNITEQWKQATNEAFPIYRQNRGEALDFGDVGWWLENGSALGQSIGGFAIGGGAIAKGLTGLSKLTKARKLAQSIVGINKAEKAAAGVKTVVTSTMLNQSEAILEATQVFDDTYKRVLTDLVANNDPDAENKARQKAADAASATINANRLNIFLNLSSSNLFLRQPRLTRNLLQKETFRRNLGIGFAEGVQESGEELINFIAGQYGRAKGADKKYGFEDIVNDLGKPEAHEAALLGFIGGLGQTIITKEGVNRYNNITDPETGEKISVRDYNRKAYEAQQQEIANNDNNAKASDVKSFTDAFNNTADNIEIYEGYKKALEDGNEAEAERFRQLTLNNQAYNAFKTGTTESLIDLYRELGQGEQKEGMGPDYKQKAQEAVAKITELEKRYNEASKYANDKEVYINRAQNYDLTEQFKTIDTDINDARQVLQEQIDIVSEGTSFDPNNTDGDSFTFDVNNIDFNPAAEALTGNKKAVKEFDTINSLIKNSPTYQAWNALKDAKQKIKDNLAENIRRHNEITSPKYQQEYEDRQDRARQEALKQVDKQVDNVEKEIKKDEKAAAKAKRDADVADINAATDQEIDNARQANDKANERLREVADNYNEGEKIPLDGLGKEFEGEVGTVTKVDEKPDGTPEVTIETEDGDIITEADPISPRYKNNDIDPIYNTEGSEAVNTTNQDSIKKSEEIANKKDSDKDGNKLSDIKLISTYKDSGKILPGVPQAFVDYERNGADKKGTKVNFEINRSLANVGQQSSEIESKKEESYLKDLYVWDSDANNYLATMEPNKDENGKITSVTIKKSLAKDTITIPITSTEDKLIRKALSLYTLNKRKEGTQLMAQAGKAISKRRLQEIKPVSVNKKFSKFNKAIKLYDRLLKGEQLSKEDKNFVVDYLPLKAKVNDSNEVYTFLMSKPATDNKNALLAYNNRTRPLRVAIVKAGIDGNPLSEIYTTIKGQYGGTLNMDKIEAENNPLELDYINNELSNVELFVINDEGQLVDFKGNYAKGWTKTKDNWKGSTYMKIKKANGEDFYLNLNFGKVSKSQANAIFDIYKVALNRDIRPTTLISNLDDNVQKSILKNLRPEIALLRKVGDKNFGQITMSELLDVVFWDGSKSPKSILRINYANQTIDFGPNSYKASEFTDDVRDEFVNWVTTNKNRNFKFKSKSSDAIPSLNSTQPDYLEYVFNSGILTTNAKVNTPTFTGFTNLYVNNGLSGVTKVASKPKPAPAPKPKAPKVTRDYNPSTDTNLRFANVAGTSYQASIDSGRVFEAKNIQVQPGQPLPTLDEQIGALVKDNDIINQVEQAVRNNPFIPAPNATFKRYDAAAPVAEEVSTPPVEKSEEIPLKSQEKVVSLQENELTTESDEVKPVTKAPKRTRPLTRKERMNRARGRGNNNLNKHCKN